MTRREQLPPELEHARRPSQIRRFLHNSPKLQYERPAGTNRIFGGQTGLVVVEDRGNDEQMTPDHRAHLIRAIVRAGFLVLVAATVTSPLWSRWL